MDGYYESYCEIKAWREFGTYCTIYSLILVFKPVNTKVHYETTGAEQTQGKVGVFVFGVGSGSALFEIFSKVGKYLKEKNPKIQVWAIDPYGSLLTKFFRTGDLDMSQVHPYVTEGIGEDFVPQNYDMKYIDAFEQVTDKDAAIMARRIAREEGLFCGYSAGTAVQGLIQLKGQLQKGDLVVVILHDHGSRYVAKIYNDQWMIERGFLDVKTFKDIIASRGTKRLITASPENTVAEAFELMQKYHVENLPVLRNGESIGAISESGLFSQLMTNGSDIKGKRIGDMLEKPYPIVSFDTPLERLSTLITRENGAVLGKDDSGSYHIVTKYDLIQALGA